MKHVHFLKIAVFCLPVLFPAFSNAQDFVNGSFEKNGNLCLINASTSVFNANVKNTRAFGNFRKPDIASSDCGYGAAKDGNWFVGLATYVQGDIRSEIITMELGAPLEKGNQYSISFWARSRTFAPDLEIGQSVSDSSSGVTFYTVAAETIGADWTEINVRFTAQNNGKYISVRATHPSRNSGVWLDAFHLHPVFQPDNVVMSSKTDVSRPDATTVVKKTQTASIGLYPNPTEGVFKVNADSTQLSSLTVYNMLGSAIEQHVATPDQPIPDKIDLSSQQPGMYFVEMSTTAGEKLTKRIIVSW